MRCCSGWSVHRWRRLKRIGDARAADTQIGPVSSAQQLAVDEAYLQTGKNEGAVLAIGGERLKRANEGYYLSPALFIDANPAMAICREEIFGPIAAILRVRDYDEALDVANDCDFGLSAGIVTGDRKRIDHFWRNMQAGMIQVNLPTAGMDFHAPFTGRKGSSYGPPEKGSYCREFFTAPKVVHAL